MPAPDLTSAKRIKALLLVSGICLLIGVVSGFFLGNFYQHFDIQDDRFKKVEEVDGVYVDSIVLDEQTGCYYIGRQGKISSPLIGEDGKPLCEYSLDDGFSEEFVPKKGMI